jgi:hypothetical protein
MSTYDKVKHVRTLLASSANNMSLMKQPLMINNQALITNGGGLNFTNISKLIAESKTKVVNLLNRQQQMSNNNSLTNQYRVIFDSKKNRVTCLVNKNEIHASKEDDKRIESSNSSISNECYFESMLDLANFVLFENEKLIFTDLTELDKSSIDYFAQEIDSVQKDLLDIFEQVNRMKSTYKNYCENLLILCDQKDELCEQFLDYYDEYIIGESCNAKKLKKKSNNKTKSSKKNDPNQENRTENEKDEHEEEEAMENFDVEDIFKFTKPVAKLVRRKSNIYSYSVPTENRFSILGKIEKGPPIKRS